MNRALSGFLLACLCLALSAHASIVTSKHNLSVSGPGTVKATNEEQICVFCHTPHNARPQTVLWNRSDPTSTYTPYASSTAKGGMGQPDGASLMCLSCHDGTVALGNVLSRPTPIAMTSDYMPPTSASYLGTDLSDDHPVSISYFITAFLRGGTGQSELADFTTLLSGRVRIDNQLEVQCTSCHDPHDDSNGKFLVISNQSGALCKTCHLKNYWNQSSHALSAKTWNGIEPNPWTHSTGATVAANACDSCHRMHTAPFRQWLQNAATEEANCYPCHNGNVASQSIELEFVKLSIHPIAQTTGVHDPAEYLSSPFVQSRHVECVDCHNPHASNASTGPLSGALTGVQGVDINGSGTMPSTTEYQICFRCHADSPGQPAQRTMRQIAQVNTRLQFNTGNPSFHPVAGPGKGTSVPSLIPPLTVASIIKCSDCHNNDSGPGAGGVGPKGPHGSNNPTLMERPYATNSPAISGDICFKCHSQSAFPSGTLRPHQTDHLMYGCGVCHDPHGISSTQGTTTFNSRLMNFNLGYVAPNPNAANGLFANFSSRTCTLRCHTGDGDKDHNARPFN